MITSIHISNVKSPLIRGGKLSKSIHSGSMDKSIERTLIYRIALKYSQIDLNRCIDITVLLKILILEKNYKVCK